jgi:hypothetical protein
MTPTNFLSHTLQRLPQPLRKTLYSLIGLIGVALAACAALGFDDLGPVTLARALEVYAFVSAAIGGVAFANVGAPSTPPVGAGEFDFDFDEDVDLSSFEPIGHVDDVFGQAPA